MTRTVGYLGPSGTNSESAALAYVATIEGTLVPFLTIFDVIMAVQDQQVDEGVVPIENSSEGSVSATIDMLADKDIKLKVRQELDIPIIHALMARPGLKQENIKEVISHPQGLAQCQHYIRKNFPGINTITTGSTAGAAAAIADGTHPDAAAIAPPQAAEKLGLTILDGKVNDYDSTTRFVVLAKHDHKPTENDKTSIAFSIKKDKPGGLFEILGEFAKRSINLTKIESRPRKKAMGDYVFFIDLQGHRKEEKIAAVLKNIGQKVSFFKLLGSYPAGLK